jgi:hypothetical protein
MQPVRSMGSRVYIDREKHEVDVAEHVLGGVRTEDGAGVRAHIVALDAGLRGWPLGLVASAVQVQVLDAEDAYIIEPRDRPRPADDRTRSPHLDHERRRSH